MKSTKSGTKKRGEKTDVYIPTYGGTSTSRHERGKKVVHKIFATMMDGLCLWIYRLLVVSFLVVNARKSGSKGAVSRRRLEEVKHDCQLTSFRTPSGVLDIIAEDGNSTLAPYFFHEKRPGVYEVRLMPNDKADINILLNRLTTHGYASHVMEHEKLSSWQFFQCMIASKVVLLGLC